ncbi:MAG: hypothetical protein IJS81_00225 [Selenomonadaceae bacterium]|nr:hypothetical protein [Selenomonadaceae bacterium]
MPIFCLTLNFAYSENFTKIFAKLYPFLLAGITSFILLNVLEILLVRGHNVNVRILYAPYILAALSFIAAT